MRFPSETLRPSLSSDPFVEDGAVEILEVRPEEADRPLTITLAIAADAIQAVCLAVSEQLARRAHDRAESAEEVLALREHTEFVERLQPLADAGAHAVVRFSQADLRMCLLELSRYAERAGGEHYQAPDLRARLELIDRIAPVLWEANAAAVNRGR